MSSTHVTVAELISILKQFPQDAQKGRWPNQGGGEYVYLQEFEKKDRI